ncbi:MAG: SHOCT domain-containing protein, partial [Deltaproteobacteria bacterium]|nr:SHOCT domain-containing protein [Deltaproteobacteria bacterium]
GVTVQLISKRGDNIELNHPITIAPVRLSHILARIDIRLTAKDSQQRVPAFHIEEIDGISEGLAKGLREAAPNQRVIVYSIRREKRFGIFETNYLTSFLAYAHGEHLFLHLSRSSWEIPPRRKDSLPEPKIGKFPSKFRILPSKAMRLVDEQSLAISWSNKIFERPTRTRVTPSGQMIRKTILMESDEPESEAEAEPEQPAGQQTIPAGISAKTLRALADLEERRQRGEIDEYAYERERNKILAADPAAGSN